MKIIKLSENFEIEDLNDKTTEDPTSVEKLDPYEKLRDDPGVVWHATSSNFNDFYLKEIGFHFAETPELALNAASLSGKQGAVAKPFRLSVRNMLEITGQKNGFGAEDLLEDMLDRGYINDDQFNEAYDALEYMDDNPEEFEDRIYKEMESKGIWVNEPMVIYKQAQAEVLKPFLYKWGIDSFKYWNTFDAYGLYSVFLKDGEEIDSPVQPNWSYIALDNNQITPLSL